MENRYISQLREHFSVGRVIYDSYWMKYDKVIAFNTPAIGGCVGSWSVTVATCDKDGNIIEEPREHCTAPMPK